MSSPRPRWLAPLALIGTLLLAGPATAREAAQTWDAAGAELAAEDLVSALHRARDSLTRSLPNDPGARDLHALADRRLSLLIADLDYLVSLLEGGGGRADTLAAFRQVQRRVQALLALRDHPVSRSLSLDADTLQPLWEALIAQYAR